MGDTTLYPGLPAEVDEFLSWDWGRIEPFYQELLEAEIDSDKLETWLDHWTHLNNILEEGYAVLYVDSAANTRDEKAEERFQNYFEKIFLKAEPWQKKLKEKFLASGLTPQNFERPLENMRSDVEIFQEKNLPLMAESEKLSSRYSKISGEQTVKWLGEEKTIQQLKPCLESEDRAERETVWRLAAERQLRDRDAYNQLWQEFLDVRMKMAANLGLEDYRQFRFKELRRFDYSQDDCATFHSTIEQVVVPAAKRIYQHRQEELGLSDSLRPWDVDGQPHGQTPLKPFRQVDELKSCCLNIFRQVDDQLGDYFETMIREDLLDLDNRPGKAPGGFCINYSLRRRPFIFMNAVGLHDDVQTLLHEAGHCFHDFSIGRWFQQAQYGTEFAEVASMAMELLSSRYLGQDAGGFYGEEEMARANLQHLERSILFWPYMAVVDAFQHWAYGNTDLSKDPANCDRKWGELWDRFMQGIDYSGLEDVKNTGWHRKLHIFQYPLYYVEYGLAQMGAVQVWGNSLRDHKGAVASYKRALAAGARPLPELFAMAGGKFAFDVDTMSAVVQLMESEIAQLRGKLN